jgi:iron complex transport system substrate-binding protein
MKRRTSLQALVSVAAVGALPTPFASSWAQGTRDTGNLPAEAGRLVSVHGSLTELVYLLGAQGQLVGTDTTSTHPEPANRTPKVGYLRQLSAEGLLALRPHAVLGTDEAGPPIVLHQLRQAGVPLRLITVTHRFQDVLDKVHLVGEATRRTQTARNLAADLDARWQGTRQRVQASPPVRPARVLFIMAHGGAPMTAGQGTAAQAVLELIGARNALEDVQGFRPLNAESVVQARPDWVLTTTDSLAAMGGVDRFWQQAGLAQTPAARQQRLIDLDAMALLGFGPRMPATLDELHRRLS